MSPPEVKQLVNQQGEPSHAAHTEQIWAGNGKGGTFATPTSGNKVVSFISGRDYFADLIQAFDNAKSEICIAGWQINWDAMLAPNVRLYDVLERAAARGVNIYVMPWDDTQPIQTYDDQAKTVLESINTYATGGKMRVFVQPCPSFASVNKAYFSHHQKQVVVDRAIAYVGGIDLSYGRFDDDTFSLRADADGRKVLNRYNPCVPSLQKIASDDKGLVDPDLMSGLVDRLPTISISTAKINPSAAQAEQQKVRRGGYQVPYMKASTVGIMANAGTTASNTPDFSTLDAALQPRMPWQDVQCRVEGPSVAHLLKNFVCRWNAVSKVKLAPAPAPETYPAKGKANVQVLRSAARQHCRRELLAQSPGSNADTSTQQDIYTAMCQLIKKARHFIYIENQFFVSHFGRMQCESTTSSATRFIAKDTGAAKLEAMHLAADGRAQVLKGMPQNGILHELLERLKLSILDVTKPHFHLYITIPVHPEGSLLDPTVSVQVFFTMQTLVFGSSSLINGTRRLLKAQELRDAGDTNFARVLDDRSNEYETVPIEACAPYITLLNLRNWTKIGDRYVTEQIYIHTKMMIVDDRFALIGSANVNDRSLLGERDSELSILVVDDDTQQKDICGDNKTEQVRSFAYQTRVATWRKLFGISGNVRPATTLLIAIERPGDPESARLIQLQSGSNAAIYEAAFDHIPRNYLVSNGRKLPASILPTWGATEEHPKGTLTAPLSSQAEFWTASQPIHSAFTALDAVKGFITALPLHWSRSENNLIGFPVPLIAQEPRNKSGPAAAEPPLTDIELAEANEDRGQQA